MKKEIKRPQGRQLNPLPTHRGVSLGSWSHARSPWSCTAVDPIHHRPGLGNRRSTAPSASPRTSLRLLESRGAAWRTFGPARGSATLPPVQRAHADLAGRPPHASQPSEFAHLRQASVGMNLAAQDPPCLGTPAVLGFPGTPF